MSGERPTNYKIEQEQSEVCAHYGCDYIPVDPESKLGFALDTKDLLPMNGLRHPPEADTNGWYLWSGEVLPTDDHSFSAVHTKHLFDLRPEVGRFLGLPPGYRFLVAGDYIDVWFDATLLNV